MKQYMLLSVPTRLTVSTGRLSEPKMVALKDYSGSSVMFEIFSAIFGVVIVGGAAALAYAIYLTSGFPTSERRHPGRSL